MPVRNEDTELPELGAKLANMEGLKEHGEACGVRVE